MKHLRACVVRVRNLFRKRQLEQDLAEEFESNVQLEIDANLRSGMTVEEARRRTLAKFGSVDSVKEQCRDRRGIPILEAFARDVGYAVRMLRQSKNWTAVAILSLALGIGLNTALFSIVDGVLLETLPVPNPHELVSFRWIGENNTARGMIGYGYTAPDPKTEKGDASFTRAVFEQFRSQSHPLADLFAFAPDVTLNVVVNGERNLASGQFVSGNFYSALGVSAVRGRTIGSSDDSPSADPVAVISHAYWDRQFGMNPAVVGSSITINNVTFTIVGIAPLHLGSPARIGRDAQDISIPLQLEPRVRGNASWLNRPGNWWLLLMGRLRPEATIEQLQAKLAGVFDETVREEAQQNDPRIPQLRIVNGRHGVFDVLPRETDTLAILAAIVAMVLIIVCVNLANLLLSRGATRQREIAVRLAIGASRPRVIQQLLTESLVLAAIGGTLGLLVAYWCRALFPVWMGFQPADMDWRVLEFTAVLTLLTAIFFGLVPAFRASRVDFGSAIREESIQFSRSRSWFGKSLLIAQVAMSFVLMVGAGLFAQTLHNLRSQDMGFNPDNIVLFSVNSRAAGYDAARAATLNDEILERLAAHPNVGSATRSNHAILTGVPQYSFSIEGLAGEPLRSCLFVHANYFEAMEVPVKLGRGFTPRDNETAPPVVVINEAFAKEFFPNTNPIGRNIKQGATQRQIVGVVGDAKYGRLRESVPSTFYLPEKQWPLPGGGTFTVRAAGETTALIPAIRDVIRVIDSKLPPPTISTLTEKMDDLLRKERTLAVSSTLFGALVLVISMVGIFGLMSYMVSRRIKEIGIQMALGAERNQVLRSIVGEALALVAVGALIGLGAALGLTRFVASQLFGLAPHDPVTLSIAVLLMIAVAVLAGYLPARRASRVDPMAALRHE